MGKLTVKQQILGLQDKLMEEFEAHYILVSCLYLDEARHLKVNVNYPLATNELTLDVLVPQTKLKQFFLFIEQDLKVNIYKFIKESAKRWGYGT